MYIYIYHFASGSQALSFFSNISKLTIKHCCIAKALIRRVRAPNLCGFYGNPGFVNCWASPLMIPIDI